MHRMTMKKGRQKPNLKTKKLTQRMISLLIDSEVDEQRNIDQKGKRFGKVMCVEGNQKEKRTKSCAGWEGRKTGK